MVRHIRSAEPTHAVSPRHEMSGAVRRARLAPPAFVLQRGRGARRAGRPAGRYRRPHLFDFSSKAQGSPHLVARSPSDLASQRQIDEAAQSSQWPPSSVQLRRSLVRRFSAVTAAIECSPRTLVLMIR